MDNSWFFLSPRRQTGRRVIDAGDALNNIIVGLQQDALAYLVPDGISRDEFIARVVGALDCHKTLSAQIKWREAKGETA